MEKLNAIVDRPSTGIILDFISNYRHMEVSNLKYGYSIITRVLVEPGVTTDKQLEHYHDKWHHNKKDFGSYYLGSLSYRQQMMFLEYWNITSADFQPYKDKCAADYTYGFLNKPPEIVLQFHKLILFFNNHGINKEPLPGFVLDKLPRLEDRFGNSKNWGKYLLTLPEPDAFLDYLFTHYEG